MGQQILDVGVDVSSSGGLLHVQKLIDSGQGYNCSSENMSAIFHSNLTNANLDILNRQK